MSTALPRPHEAPATLVQGHDIEAEQLLETLTARVDRRIEEFLPRKLGAAHIRRFLGAPVWRHDPEASTAALCEPLWDLLDRKGKRWRPVFGILLLEALGMPSEPYDMLLCLTAELMHTGSLIVDDIEDDSRLRRGAPCIHRRYGLPAAINAANTLYFLPFLHLFEHPALSEAKRYRISEVIIRQCVRAHFGQGLDIQWSQHLSAADLDQRPADNLPSRILEMYRGKTGAVVEGLAEVACTIADASDDITQACKAYAVQFSAAFQIMDDVHNFSDSPKWSKQPGEDVAEGKLTYVIVRALQRLDGAPRQRLAAILCTPALRGDTENLREACTLVRASGALGECSDEANRMASAAWDHFVAATPDSSPRELLRLLAWRLLSLE